MHRIFFQSIFILMMISVINSGCANTAIMSPHHPEDYKKLGKKVDAFESEKTELLKRYDAPSTSASDKISLRDHFARMHFEMYDYACWMFRSELYGRSSGIVSGGKIAALGLSAAAAVTSPIQTSHLLSGIGGAVLGSTEVLRQEFFGDVAQYLIVGKMDTLRQAKKAEILQSLTSPTATPEASIANYPLSKLQADMDEYLESCTVMSAVAGLAGTTKTSAVQGATQLGITTATLPNGTNAVAYSALLAATGGNAPYRWTIPNGSLPDGLQINNSTGSITGTPSTAGTSTITVQATDASTPPQNALKVFSITIQ